MSIATNEPKFLLRFERVWASLRRYQVRLGLCRAALAAALGLLILVAIDHRLELPWSLRAIGLAAALIVTLTVLWRAVIAPLRWWTRPRTAAEIEARFPQIGQRIRTVVQYAGLSEARIHSEGATPSLVAALSEETEVRAGPLPIDTIVPWRRVWTALALASIPALGIVTAALVDLEWWIALDRALLSDRPYTTIAVAPGDVTVDQGASLPIAVELKGRPRRNVVLQSPPIGASAAPWTSIALEPPEGGPPDRRATTLETVRSPLVYRVIAGPSSSRTSRVAIRYPLALTTFRVTLSPPSYTGLAPETVPGGDLKAVEGTVAVFRVAFDAPTIDAALVLSDPNARSKGKGKGKDKDLDVQAPQVIALKPEGRAFTAQLSMTRDLDYRVVARSGDGRSIPRRDYRIDVRADRAPRVAFEEPVEALEVHPIAEVVHRVRLADDFGLSRAGIVFRVNDGEERTLIARDFAPQSGKPQAAATLEETLTLESLALSPTDSVTYYAFAEDNFPGGPRRTETDLRYIDIRPFKRSYRLSDPGGQGGESTTLEELIARQRFNLNRTVRLARRRPGDRTEPEDPLKIASFEEMLAGLTREYTEGIVGVAGPQFEMLHEAEASMLAAVDALDRRKDAEAPPLESSALRNLIAARRTFQMLVCQGSNMAQALRSFDRKQAQKIRKPRGKDEEAEALVAEIEELAGDEDFVYATIADAATSGGDNPAEEREETDVDSPDQQGEPVEKGRDQDVPKRGQKSSRKGSRGSSGSGKSNSPGMGGGGKKLDRRAIAEEQERIADEARALEERLKRVEAASELSRLRMARAAEAADRASGALTRGRPREAAEAAKGGASLLHELAKQVKGEITREVADEIAMASDLAQDLAEREAELGALPASSSSGTQVQDDSGASPGDRGTPTEADRLERLAESARTLEEWLKQIARRGDGKAGEAARALLEQGVVAGIIRQIDRIAALDAAGERVQARREAAEVAKSLEVLARSLDMLHRDIVAPRLAALVGFDRRLDDLVARLTTLTTKAEVDEWHRQAVALVRELEAKEGVIVGVADLEKAMADAGWHAGIGTWRWAAGDHRSWIAPGGYTNAVQTIARQIEERIQELLLKDVVSARDEATPPEFKELVDRYYEVLSRKGGGD